MTKEFQSPNDKQKPVTRAGFLGLGHWALFSHSSLWFSHLQNRGRSK
jgi:hypothetical protein